MPGCRVKKNAQNQLESRIDKIHCQTSDPKLNSLLSSFPEIGIQAIEQFPCAK